jgi:hypothetical protein
MVEGVFPTDDEHRAIEEWFKSKQITLTCSQCNSKRFDAGRPVVAPVVMPDGGWTSGFAFAFLPMVCERCAHVEWFFPRNMGPDLEHLGRGVG